MASLDLIWDKILDLEGGYVNNIHDHGGPTKFGVTLATWQQLGVDKNRDGVINAEDIKLLTKDDAYKVAKWFWDYFHCTNIDSQEIANMVYDWGWASGVGQVAKWMQHYLGVPADGVFGSGSLAALNKRIAQKGAFTVFDEIKQMRFNRIDAWVNAHPDQSIFLKGWLRRINGFATPQKKK